MNLAQRIVAVAYCLLILYCSLWIPTVVFEITTPNGVTERTTFGYGWLWSAQINEVPLVAIIGLRLIAATAVSAAAFLIAGIRKRT